MIGVSFFTIMRGDDWYLLTTANGGLRVQHIEEAAR
jgi:beta-xylosidase